MVGIMVCFGVLLLIVGVFTIVYTNTSFYFKMKRIHPDIYLNLGLGWSSSDAIRKKLKDENNCEMLKLYKIANYSPAYVFISFAIYLILFRIVILMLN